MCFSPVAYCKRLLFVVSTFLMFTANSLSFLILNKRKILLVLDDYVYPLKKQAKDKKYWICQKNVCTAYVHTDIDNIFIKSSGDHNHLCEPEISKNNFEVF